ncbi:MAG: ChaN family lipoprotein [Candidatus Brocadia sp.]
MKILKHFWLKSLSSLIAFLLTFHFILPMSAFSDADRSKNFPAQVEIGDIIHVPTGQKIPFPALSGFFDCASVLYVGETHANKASHEVQLKILKAHYERFGNRLAIGMEMFTRPYQPFLDQWIAGEIDEEKLLEDTRWYGEWGFDYALYKEILDFAREKKIPVIALNAPKEVVTMVRTKGLTDLSEEEKKLLPEIDTSDFFHRFYLEKVLPSHVKQKANIERFDNVQCLWEEYMAQTIADYLSSWEGKDRKFLAFVGNGHIIYDFGIPKRVFRRTFLPYYTIYNTEFKDGKPIAQHLFMPEIPLEPADFVWAIAPLAPEKKRIYLGVQFQKRDDNKLVIEKITPKSPAEKTGFMEGDVILSIDYKALKNVIELVHHLQTKQFGDTCTVEIDRDGTKITYAVTLFEFEREEK